ncbi:hypothetical protein [Anoxybacillus gonensis]|uniref:hypothetical protein n=1 Tax=Anoxybacillus gonensis TaxID=198467 RepID=UPI0002BFE91B|nr:hypothetical protein [Anoxybacillus gonensis]EMI11396.1 hypothetical protein F510_0573 [Anoxybacillus gonensis]
MAEFLFEYDLFIFNCCFRYTILKFTNKNNNICYAAGVARIFTEEHFEMIQGKIFNNLADAKEYLLMLNEVNFQSGDIEHLNESIHFVSE